MDSHALLPDAVRFKWVTAVGQVDKDVHETLLTEERTVIEDWARRRGAEPATGKGKIHVEDGGSGLRFDFPGMGRFAPLSWDDWFREFEAYKLVFVYRECREDGQLSQDYRIVARDHLPADMR